MREMRAGMEDVHVPNGLRTLIFSGFSPLSKMPDAGGVLEWRERGVDMLPFLPMVWYTLQLMRHAKRTHNIMAALGLLLSDL